MVKNYNYSLADLLFVSDYYTSIVIGNRMEGSTRHCGDQC